MTLLAVLAVYLGAGLLFAIIFAARGVSRLDVQAEGAGLGFRLLIVPGVTALWPFFLWSWLNGRRVE